MHPFFKKTPGRPKFSCPPREAGSAQHGPGGTQTACRRHAWRSPVLAVLAAASVFFASSSHPAAAQERLKPDLLKLYGGVYSPACADSRAPRAQVRSDALLVEHAGKRTIGRKLRSAYSYYGNVTPPHFRVGLMGQVRSLGELNFIVFEDKRGSYLTIEGDAKVQASLGKVLSTARYRRCDGDSAQVAAASAAVTPAIPAQDEPVSDAEKMLLNPLFRSAYLRALGPLAKERWLARLDGPRPPTRQVRLDGVEYLFIAVCKPHDCADHNTALLYAEGLGTVFGKVFQDGKTTLIGAPPPPITSALEQMWAGEWRRK